jgi:hypothetical protein
MNDDPSSFEQLSPAEWRLREHLTLLRTGPPEPDPAIVGRIVRRARSQRAVRGPLRAMGHLAAALSDGIRLLLATRRARS